MFRRRVVLEIADLLEQHSGGRQGLLTEKSRREAFFHLFRECYPTLDSVALRDAVLEEWLTRDGRVDEAHHQALAQLTLAWKEWAYAWEKYEIRLPEVGG